MNHSLARRRLVKVGWVAVVAVVFAIAAIALLHMPGGRPALSRLGSGASLGACPAKGVSAAPAEQAQREAVKRSVGTVAAPSRPAFGFDLDSTRLKDVESWAAAHKVRCEHALEQTLYKCIDVPAAAFPDHVRSGFLSEVIFQFSSSNGKLRGVTGTRVGMRGVDAERYVDSVVGHLRDQLGAPSKEVGSRSADSLESAPFATSVVSYSHSDYLADVTSTNFPDRGVSVLEKYLSAVY